MTRSEAAHRWPLILLTAALVMVASSCVRSHRSGGAVTVFSTGPEAVRVSGAMSLGTYTVDANAESLFIMSDVPIEELLSGDAAEGQVLAVSLLWEPKPGRTPIDETATNLSVRYLVISNGEFGAYAGGGFGWPRGNLGDPTMTISLESCSMRLLAGTDGFVDRLGHASVRGAITAQLDLAQTRQSRLMLQQMLTNSFGPDPFDWLE